MTSGAVGGPGDAPVLTRLRVAASPAARMRGLMFRRSLPDGEGLLIRPASGIHTHFMRFPLDLVFLDAEGRVLRLREGMRPWRVEPASAWGVIEAPVGTIGASGLRVGDRLRFDPERGGVVLRG